MAKNYDLRREVKASATISTDGLATEVTLQGVKDNTDKLQFLDGKLLVDTGLDETSVLAYQSSVGQSNSSVQLLDEDIERKELFIRNDSDSDMYVSYRDAATNTSVLKLSKDDVLYENKYKGVINAIWGAAGGGFARILNVTKTIIIPPFPTLPNLILRIESDDETTINGGLVSDGDFVYQIDDKSGNGNDLIQATGINQPTYTGGYLKFDGNDVMNTTTPNTSSDFTISFWYKDSENTLEKYAIVWGTGYTSNEILFDFDYNFGLQLFWNANSAQIQNGVKGDYTDGTWRHFMAIRSGTTIELFINNVSQQTSTTNTSFTLGSNLYVGARASNGTKGIYGNITGIVITQSALNSTERTDLYNYNQPT